MDYGLFGVVAGGGLSFSTHRQQGQQQRQQRLMKVQGHDQRQSGFQEQRRIGGHKLWQCFSHGFILSGR